MPPALRVLLALLALAFGIAVLRPAAPTAAGGGTGRAGADVLIWPTPTAASRRRSLTFEAVAAGDQQAILTAIAAARPEARRLIDAVAGLTTIRVGSAGPDAAGSARATVDGYRLELDLGHVSAALGARGVDRLVLHELGHVVDFALVDDRLGAALVAQVPTGYGCEDGRTGGCTVAAERFAETFAKWAMDDIGVGLEIGYRVPPPTVALEAWGAPLTRLAG